MKPIKTFVINLEKATLRRKYMETLLSGYNILDVEFINAVDGRKLSDEEREGLFDDKECQSLIGRTLNGGEVGCTLSHRKCYEALLNSDKQYALVLEDDISLIRDLNEIRRYDINKLLNEDVPIVLLLSGDYWYWQNRDIVSVYDCIGAYAYIINRAAARLILSYKAATVADYWKYFISYGLKIKAIKPYMIDANLKMDLLSSDVDQYSWGICRSKMSFGNAYKSYYRAIVKRILKLIGHFEYKTTVRNGKAEPGTKH